MTSKIVERLPRVEGIINVVNDPSQLEDRVVLESGRSIFLERRMEGRYPLEAVQLSQSLSSKSCVAHAIAAVSAIENYLQLDPTGSASSIRLIMLRLSTIYSHIHHFYLELLPDYLCADHFSGAESKYLKYLIGFLPADRKPGDLDQTIGKRVLSNISPAIECLNQLQKSLTALGGKFPIVMNIIPGGVSNFKIKPTDVMEITRRLDHIKPFVESTWPEDVKSLITASPEMGQVLEKQVNLISFGSQSSDILKDLTSVYSDGVWINGKLEPVNELKVTESFENTYFVPLNKLTHKSDQVYDVHKPDARSWIKGARYDDEPMLTGALARMLVTHFGGGNMEISDRIGQVVNDLNISIDSPNCVASRLLAEVFECRFLLRAILATLLDFEFDQPLNRDISFDFGGVGAGIGKVEAPNGSLMHQVYIEKNKIAKYRIVSAMNWILSSADISGKTGIVEHELNILRQKDALTPVQATRHLHSYNIQVLDGTR